MNGIYDAVPSSRRQTLENRMDLKMNYRDASLRGIVDFASDGRHAQLDRTRTIWRTRSIFAMQSIALWN